MRRSPDKGSVSTRVLSTFHDDVEEIYYTRMSTKDFIRYELFQTQTYYDIIMNQSKFTNKDTVILYDVPDPSCESKLNYNT